MNKLIQKIGAIIVFAILGNLALAQPGVTWLSFEPEGKMSNGQHIVLLSGDEEYRSEESMPMLAKILTHTYGFKTTVLFAINEETGEIDPNHQTNIPGMKALESADLVIMLLRFRELPDEQMKYFDNYLKSGKPIIGLRTSTHAFRYSRDKDSPYAKYDFSQNNSVWSGGFGRRVLGETWINHHGIHGKEGTRALVDGLAEVAKHPVLEGVRDIWCPTDVYGIIELPEDATVLIWGQSTNGMTATSPVNWKKSIMPVAWTKSYKIENGKTGKVFTTTMGAATDLVNPDLRRLVINACYWALDKENMIDPSKSVDVIGSYNPTQFGFNQFVKGKKPKDYQ
ncbi:ThuA domain-containing protein [Membranihabitans marinus]|uniref:ThuA domain-containing protein n=1 Tax=Membranihabitans marinus TaxID=1227546 RepID=UPI001F1D32CF|nr:ThuA domain-containing protein [Membranihabitans marinus]